MVTRLTALDIHELASLAEVAIDRILTANQELAYIQQVLTDSADHDATWVARITDEGKQINHAYARILYYLSRTALEREIG